MVTTTREHATLRTTRLILRPWKDEDRAPFAEMCADAEVMRHFPATLTREQSDALIDRMHAHFAAHSFGVWAIEIPNVAPFVGFVGIVHVNFESHFTPAIEIGWRLARAAWGQGFATEAARASLRFAFTSERIPQIPEIVALTIPANVRSWRVMERIGMTRDPKADFDHPRLPEGHALRRHILYRVLREHWIEANPEIAAR